MDRRQLLVGMTAMGLVSQLNISQLLHAQSVDSTNQNSRTKRFYPPDLDLNEPRGPVKTCVEERTAPDGGVMTHVYEYSPDGKMISSRFEQDGRPSFSTDDYQHTEVRDDEGRLVKFVSGPRGAPGREYSYAYDQAGRMLTTTNNENSDRIEYHYGPDGLMTSVQSFDPKTIERTRNAAFAGSPWDASDCGFGVPTGSKVITTYDKDNNGTELRVLTGDGQLVTQIVRKYDPAGLLLEEKPLQQNLAFLMLDRMPPERRASLTPEWMEAVNASMAGKKPSQTTYKYDGHGRFIEKVDRNMIFENTITIRYNDYGDRIEERRTFKENSRMPIGVPHTFDADGNGIPSEPVSEVPERRFLPEDTIERYAYQYDRYGNWTQRIETRNDGFTLTTRRTITYY